MFSDLGWPLNASRGFVCISWGSCFTTATGTGIRKILWTYSFVPLGRHSNSKHYSKTCLYSHISFTSPLESRNICFHTRESLAASVSITAGVPRHPFPFPRNHGLARHPPLVQLSNGIKSPCVYREPRHSRDSIFSVILSRGEYLGLDPLTSSRQFPNSVIETALIRDADCRRWPGHASRQTWYDEADLTPFWPGVNILGAACILKNNGRSRFEFHVSINMCNFCNPHAPSLGLRYQGKDQMDRNSRPTYLFHKSFPP